MSLTISSVRDGPPYPIPTCWTLVCEGDHGLLPAPTLVLWHHDYPNRFISSVVVEKGWSITWQRVVCPECKGRK